MKYSLVNADIDDIPKIKEFKLRSIFDYNGDVNEVDKDRIIRYVDEKIPRILDNVQMVISNEKTVGTLIVYEYEDGLLLDEIYLEEEFRGRGIGTNLIKDIFKFKKNVYLWVYKNNRNALNLYKSLGFIIILKTSDRYQMKRETKSVNEYKNA